MRTVLVVLIGIYRSIIGPLLHAAAPAKSGCRFSPSCSEYLSLTVRREGVSAGLSKGAARLMRCHALS